MIIKNLRQPKQKGGENTPTNRRPNAMLCFDPFEAACWAVLIFGFGALMGWVLGIVMAHSK